MLLVSSSSCVDWRYPGGKMRGDNALELQWPRDTKVDQFEKEGEKPKKNDDDTFASFSTLVGAILLFMILSLIAWWLFAGLYNKHVYDTDAASLGNQGVNIRLMLGQLLNQTNARGRYYVGNSPVPDPTLGTPGSLYIVNQTSALYYKLDNSAWLLVLNGTSSVPGPPGADGPPGPPGMETGFNGTWSPNVTYVVGTTVVFDGAYYVSINNNTNILPTNSTNWLLQLGPINGTTPGPPGAPGPVGPDGPPGPPILMRGDYNASGTYTIGNLVIYAQWVYLAISNATSGVTPGTNPSVWLPFFNATFVGPLGATGSQGPPGTGITGPPAPPITYDFWSPSTSYNTSDEVIYNGLLYTATAPSSNISPSNTSYWKPLIGQGVVLTSAPGSDGSQGPAGNQTGRYIGLWNPVQVFGLSDVVYFNNSFWQSVIAANSNIQPSFSTPQWVLYIGALAGLEGPVGDAGGSPTQVGDGLWSSTTNYTNGDVVLYQGIYYITNASTNINNLPSVSSSYWQVWINNVTSNINPTNPTASPGPQGPPGPPGSDYIPPQQLYYGNYTSNPTGTVPNYSVVSYNSKMYWCYNNFSTVCSLASLPVNPATEFILLVSPFTNNAPGAPGPPGPPGPAAAAAPCGTIGFGGAVYVANQGGAPYPFPVSGNSSTWTLFSGLFSANGNSRPSAYITSSLVFSSFCSSTLDGIAGNTADPFIFATSQFNYRVKAIQVLYSYCFQPSYLPISVVLEFGLLINNTIAHSIQRYEFAATQYNLACHSSITITDVSGYNDATSISSATLALRFHPLLPNETFPFNTPGYPYPNIYVYYGPGRMAMKYIYD